MPNTFEYRHSVTFQDTNVARNVYFASYFLWQGICREQLLKQLYPEVVQDILDGRGFATRYATMDYVSEGFLFDTVLIRMSCLKLTRIQIEFGFDFINETSDALLAQGSQGLAWTNTGHKLGRMPAKLHEAAAQFYELGGDRSMMPVRHPRLSATSGPCRQNPCNLPRVGHGFSLAT